MKRMVSAYWPAFAACSPCVLLIPAVRYFIESRMAFHMLLEFPLLFLSGYGAFHALRRWRRHGGLRIFRFDYLGMAGLTMASCVFAFWMIPAALDAALLYPAVAAAKYASWWLAGLWIAGTVKRTNAVLFLFFLGNAAWMSATAGLLYLDTPSRLCVSYLIGDQIATGRCLMVVAFMLITVAIRCIGGRRHVDTSTVE